MGSKNTGSIPIVRDEFHFLSENPAYINCPTKICSKRFDFFIVFIIFGYNYDFNRFVFHKEKGFFASSKFIREAKIT